jgi:hypothetical protein
MTRDESVAVSDQARAAVEELRQRLGTAGLGERVIAGLATRAARSAHPR